MVNDLMQIDFKHDFDDDGTSLLQYENIKRFIADGVLMADDPDEGNRSNRVGGRLPAEKGVGEPGTRQRDPGEDRPSLRDERKQRAE